MDKLNRAERRRNKFGGGRSTDKSGWPTSEPNPVFTGPEAPDEAADATSAKASRKAAPAKSAASRQPAKKPAKNAAPETDA